jgi:hypothetical protein
MTSPPCARESGAASDRVTMTAVADSQRHTVVARLQIG